MYICKTSITKFPEFLLANYKSFNHKGAEESAFDYLHQHEQKFHNWGLKYIPPSLSAYVLACNDLNQDHSLLIANKSFKKCYLNDGKYACFIQVSVNIQWARHTFNTLTEFFTNYMMLWLINSHAQAHIWLDSSQC